jgi:cation diffusion facilitator CzcD-associated flavoprotein CzcO
VHIPTQLPAVTPKSEAVNSHQFRFSDTPLHEKLHSNIVDSIMSYTRYPFPETVSPKLREKYGPVSPYRDREIVREWVEDVFVRNGHDKLLELNTTVERAEKKDGKWLLTLRKEEPVKNWWWQERFDALVVASGHYNLPWIPKISGILEYDARFPGRLLHSKHFRNAKSYKGKAC